MADRVGQQFGNYQLVRLLGRGGFAEVYLGEHLQLRTHVAIKVLQTQLQEGDSDIFLAEAQIIARLEHPHIVRILDFDVEEGTPFFVMNYAPGGTLRTHHQRGVRVPLDLVVSYVNEMADALQYAHEEKVIHRDVKPENMLVGRRGEVVLSDFGIATLARSSYSMQIQNVAGTIAYMAPEQIQAHPRPASDQYSLAIVAYEWLCGTRPFEGTYYELITKHVAVLPPPLQHYNLALPAAIEQVILTALEKDPKRRFDNIRTFALELERASKSNASSFTGTQLAPQSLEKEEEDAKGVSQLITSRASRKIVGAKALWVDDRPMNNTYEKQALELLGIRFTISTSTEDALDRLRHTTYDVIISDMGRPPDRRAGYTLLKEIQAMHITTPFIIYAGSRAPEHIAEARGRGAFGTTNDSQELFEMVIDALKANPPVSTNY